jgi:hypothetical protein
MFMRRIPRGAKPQVKGAQGPAGGPNFVLVRAGTWRLRSRVSSQEYPMPETQWKPRGVAGQPREGPPNRSSPPH